MTHKPPTLFSKSVIDKAGKSIRYMEGEDPADFDEEFNIISAWRESHTYPLKIIAQTLRLRAQHADPDAIVSQRLKRLPSVARKLLRMQTHTMRLTSMNDMAGCRAVVSDIVALNNLREVMHIGKAKNPNRAHVLEDWYDYIEEPKKDGYRSIHYIFKYQSQSEKTSQWNRFRVEMQLRTKLQHAWATAVETYDVISGENLKFAHNDTHGSADWKRFFALMSSAIALREGTPMVPGTPEDTSTLIDELRAVARSLDVWKVFGGVQVAVAEWPNWQTISNIDQVLLRMDTKGWMVAIVPYTKRQAEQAAADLLDIEKQNDPSVLALLVRMKDLDRLRTAYPNYYVDSVMFLQTLDETIVE